MKKKKLKYDVNLSKKKDSFLKSNEYSDLFFP